MNLKIDDVEIDRDQIVAVEVSEGGHGYFVHCWGRHSFGVDWETGKLVLEYWRNSTGGVIDIRKIAEKRKAERS